MNKILSRNSLLLIFILGVGAFLRFYKLDWGQGLFTHPDEYHIAIAVNQLSFPDQMHPHFFNYGTVTIYLIYFTKLLLSTLNSSFSILNSFLIGRFYSALFSTLTIFLIYKISKTFLPKNYALLAAFFTALTPGLIQQAHFATPESNLIFFLFASLLFILYFVQSGKPIHLLISSISLGLALGVKTSGAIFILPIVFAVLTKSWPSILKTFKLGFLSLATTLTTFLISAPYVFLDFKEFLSSFQYESGLAIGQNPVFYTRQFIDTQPILFQLEKILPFALGPALTILGILGFSIMLYLILKSLFLNLKSAHTTHYLLVAATFLSLFLTNSFLFAKWTRFISPAFPFFAIFSAFLLFKLSQYQLPRFIFYILNSSFLILTSLWALAFFSIYTHDDIRITSSNWLTSNTPPASKFLLEGGNMVDIPLTGNVSRTSLDFYNLEENPLIRQQIITSLKESDYFIIQSRRVFKNHQRLEEKFPITANFYNALFDGKLGFKEVAKFTSYPSLEFADWKLEFPDEDAEETWSVFDHPVIRVFEKENQANKDEYIKLLLDKPLEI